MYAQNLIVLKILSTQEHLYYNFTKDHSFIDENKFWCKIKNTPKIPEHKYKITEKYIKYIILQRFKNTWFTTYNDITTLKYPPNKAI